MECNGSCNGYWHDRRIEHQDGLYHLASQLSIDIDTDTTYFIYNIDSGSPGTCTMHVVVSMSSLFGVLKLPHQYALEGKRIPG